MRRHWCWLLVAMVLVIPGVAVAQTEWVDDPVDPVIGSPDPGAWDQDRYPLAVINVDGMYHLYFNGQDEGASFPHGYDIGHATSSDGVTWVMDPANPVLTRGAEGEWDDDALWGVGVIYDESGFRMWYSGIEADSVARVGYATSADGSAWTKYAGNPIMDVGPPGSFDDLGVLPSTVMVRDGLYQMWYMSSRQVGGPDDWDYRIGYAESDDGLSWTGRPEPVLDTGSLLVAPSVFFDGSQYHMWYENVGGGRSEIDYAVSPDGVNWTTYWTNPVLGSVGRQYRVSERALR